MKKEIEKHKETYLSRRHIGRFLKNARKKKEAHSLCRRKNVRN